MSLFKTSVEPVPVLEYDRALPPLHQWMEKLICWFVIANGCVFAAELLIKFIPNQMAIGRFWIDWIKGINGGLLVVFGLMGLWRLRLARWGMIVCLVLTILGHLLTMTLILQRHWVSDNYSFAYEILWTFQFPLAPVLVIVCLMRHPIKDYFSK